ncbi:hypothetical protein [Smaragdicoccus niigatensis]|uniref:hypothetical protein n=1 Tax=Smaragdicoccus niigatensis TaxID=359359 RepID=UPI00037BFF15|nr:hypothetical protein [Smaragdicoccus niigatensis]
MRKLGVSAGAAVAIAIASSGVGHAAAMTPDMQTVYSSAVDLVSKYWAAHYSDFFAGTYTPPKVIGPDQTSGSTACGRVDTNDSIYCHDDHTIIYGTNYLGRADQLGDLFIYEVVAHEWGHAIQQNLKSGFVELVADCLSGAVLGVSAKAGNKALEGSDGAAAEKIFNDFLGESRPATRPEDHGTAEQRLGSYLKGWNLGVTGCLDSKYLKPQAPTPTTSTPVPPAPAVEPSPAPTGGTTPPPAAPAPTAAPAPQGAATPPSDTGTEISDLLNSLGSLS